MVHRQVAGPQVARATRARRWRANVRAVRTIGLLSGSVRARGWSWRTSRLLRESASRAARRYVSRMLDKLGCANRTQAGLLAHDAGIVGQ